MYARISALLLAFGVVMTGLAAAQEITSGSITGQVLDAQDAAVPGATVTITSEEGSKVFVTDGEGRFFAPFLTPASYTVRIELSGFAPEERMVVVRLGQRVTLNDLVLRVGGLTEVVEVNAAPPVIDVTTTTAGGVLNSDILRHLPVGRGLTDVVYMVPGVSDSSGVGRANPSIAGSSGLENAYIVDGVNIANSGYGGIGSYSGVFNSLGSGVTSDFIRETQVKTAGFEAEFGQATGGVINVVTKSGSNVFHGSGFGHTRPDMLEASWRQIQTANGTVNTTGSTSFDAGAGAGGRIIENRLFFYGTYNYVEDRQSFIAPEGFPLESLGEVDRIRFSNSYAGKLSLQQGTNHRVDFSAFGDPSKGKNGPQRAVARTGNALLAADTARFSELTKYGTHSQSGRYDAILAPSWLLEASDLAIEQQLRRNAVGQSASVHGFDRHADAAIWRPRRFRHRAARRQPAVSGQVNQHLRYRRRRQPPDSLRALVGGHRVHARLRPHGAVVHAAQRTADSRRRVGQRPAGSGVRQDLPGHARQLRPFPGNDAGLPQLLRAGYLADGSSDGASRCPVRAAGAGRRDPPLCHDDDTRPGLGDGTGPAVHCRFKWDRTGRRASAPPTTSWATAVPRCMRSWGRFYAKIPNDLAARSLSADAGITRADYFDEALTRPVAEGVLAAGQTRHFILAGLHAAEFDPDTKSTYQDEFLGGAEFEVLPETSAGIRYIRRNMPRIMEDVGTAQMVLYDLGVPGLESVEYFITNVNRNTKVFPAGPGITQAHFEDPVHTYNAVELTLDRRLANNWSAFASYRWSKLTRELRGFLPERQ